MSHPTTAFPSPNQPGDQNVELPASMANYTPLTPLSFIKRANDVYPQRLAVIHGNRKISWTELFHRSQRCAARLNALGIGLGDVVSVIAPNIPAVFELHYSVPMCGAILNTINTRLEATTIHYILEHGGAKVLFVDRASTDTVKQALEGLQNPPLLIAIDDEDAQGELIADIEYESFIDPEYVNASLPPVDPQWQWQMPADEWQSIALNYTSGTTGKPKGVIYHHRGAMMNAMSNITGWNMGDAPVYLWTLPMFHCNGWCFPWTLAINGGTSICLRNINATTIYDKLHTHKVTHFCGAPIILNMLINVDSTDVKPLSHTVQIMTAAAPPPAKVLSAIEALGFHITHTYGLTETYGPAVICAWQSQWDDLPEE